MKHLKGIIYLVIFVGFALTGCEKIEVPGGTPKCIKTKIRQEKKENCLESVYSYDYNGQTVYLFVYPCPEGCYMLLDEDCNAVTDNQGKAVCSCIWGGKCSDDLYKNRSNEKLVWKK